jgi:hypothetical protein
MTTHSLITLTNTAAMRLTPNGLHSGMDITIQNVDSSAYVFLGGEGVTASDYGYRLAPGSAWSVELPGLDAIYAITDTNGSRVALFKMGLD